ncbi:hypothetical protein [Lysinibacillus boronitolerans]|uniref:hypothetical protein n=1 Tax=Lysinibacillus boronitolerans TaxID=309788 RepID=UPI0028A2CC1F|nr:hypothetical protein [Lysinibacillus boronitolerans]
MSNIEKRLNRLEELIDAVSGMNTFQVAVYRGYAAYNNRSDRMKRNKQLHAIIIVPKGA